MICGQTPSEINPTLETHHPPIKGTMILPNSRSLTLSINYINHYISYGITSHHWSTSIRAFFRLSHTPSTISDFIRM